MDCMLGLIGILYFLGVSANSSQGKATVDTSSKGVGGKFFGNKKLMIVVGVIVVMIIVICVSIYYCSNGGGGSKPEASTGIVIGLVVIGAVLCYFFWKKIKSSFSNKFGNLFAKKAVENVVTS